MVPQKQQNPLPYFEEIHQYFLSLSNFLNITTIDNNNSSNDNTKDRSNSLRSQKARAKLLKLSPLQFYELCTDVTDELNRRIRESADTNDTNNTTNNKDGKSKSYLLPKAHYHLKRNQARQKLSNLSQIRFNDLIGDILFELRRRRYHIGEFDNESILDSKISSPKALDSEDVDTSKTETHDTTENTGFNDTGNTSELNVDVPLPSMIQSSLIIPQKASIDWSEEEEEEEEGEKNKKDETNTKKSESQMINEPKEQNDISETDSGPGNSNEGGEHSIGDYVIENDAITENIIRHNSMTSPFNNFSNDLNNTATADTVINISSADSQNVLISPSNIMNDKNNESIDDSKINLSISSPSEFITKKENSINSNEQIQSSSNGITSDPLNTDVAITNNEIDNNGQSFKRNHEDLKIAGSRLKQEKKHEELSEELSKQSSDVFSSSREHSVVKTHLQSPGSVSRLQNEMLSLNQQLTSLSIENERLKTKISELEVINSSQYGIKRSNSRFNSSKSRNQGDIANDNNVLHSLSHESIAKFINEYGIVPETLIIQLYNVVNDLYSHIDSAGKSNMNLTNSNSNINFGKILFQLVNQFYEIILKIIDLLSKTEEKDKIVLLKSAFSNLITTSKYFALYYHILPDIIIISSINECIFIIMDIVNILKVKEDVLIVEKNPSRKAAMPISKQNPGSIGVPFTPPPSVISSNNLRETKDIDGSPVKPLKIIEKVASAPLVNRNSGNDFRRTFNAIRKPSNNALITLTSMVKKHSNEKSTINKEDEDTKSSESVSNISNNTFSKRNTSNIIKRMSFASFSVSSSSDSENNNNDDDGADAEDLLQELRKQKKGADTQCQGASSLDEKVDINPQLSLKDALKLNVSASTPTRKIINKNALKEELSEQISVQKQEFMEDLSGQELTHKYKSNKELFKEESIERHELMGNIPEQGLTHKHTPNKELYEQESVGRHEIQEEFSEHGSSNMHELSKELSEGESFGKLELMEDLPRQGFAYTNKPSRELLGEESLERHGFHGDSPDRELVNKHTPDKELPEEESVGNGELMVSLQGQGFIHEAQSKEKLSQKILPIPSPAISNEIDTIPGIPSNGKMDKQFSRSSIKTKSHISPITFHTNDSTSDATSYATTSNELPSDSDTHLPKYKSTEKEIPSSFLYNDTVKSTNIETSDSVVHNNNLRNLNMQVENEDVSTDSVPSSPEVIDIKPSNDVKISHFKKGSDRIDKQIVSEQEAIPSSKIDDTILSPNLNTDTSFQSTDLPMVKPFKIMKLESRSLKKINLPLKDTKNENTPGLGIILGENTSSTTKFSDINKSDAVSLKLPSDKEMGPINKSEQCDPSGNTLDRLSSNSILIDKKEKEVVTDKTPRRTEANGFNMLDDKNSNMTLQKGDNLKMFTSPTINEEYADETNSDESSITMHPLELLNQKSLKEKSVMEADDTQRNVDNSNVSSYISHDSLDLNQTKDERELSKLKEATIIPGLKRNIDISENINEHTTADIEEKLGHLSDRSIRYEGDDNHGNITIDDDSFQFIPLQGNNIDDMSKHSNSQHGGVDEKGELTSINESTETKMVNMISEVMASGSEMDFEEERSIKELESESESSSTMDSESGSEFESGSDSSEEFDEEEDDEDEEEEEDFDVEAFDIENPDNTLSELLLYLEHQTVQVITTIQSLLTTIKEPKSTKGNLRKESNAINQVIKQMVGATSISMNQSRNANLKEHGSWVVQSLDDCSRRMVTLCQLNIDGEFKVIDNDADYADKNFKQRLAGISFDIAKCTKELVKTVEEASLKEEIEYLNSKIHVK